MGPYVDLGVCLEGECSELGGVLIVAGDGNGLRNVWEAQRQLLGGHGDAGYRQELGLEVRDGPGRADAALGRRYIGIDENNHVGGGLEGHGEKNEAADAPALLRKSCWMGRVAAWTGSLFWTSDVPYRYRI